MSICWTTVGLLILSNVFMTFAWYGPLRRFTTLPTWELILISWSIALLEYTMMVPANRAGTRAGMSLNQLKITQEAISLMVFIPISIFFLNNQFSWNYIAAMGCIFMAVWLIFH